MADTIVQVVDGRTVVTIEGSDLLAPLVTAADAAKTAAENARDIAVSSVANVYPYRTLPMASSPLLKVLRTEIYDSLNGVAITLPANFQVREIARDATSGGRFRLRYASYDGVSTYTPILREQGNGTYLPMNVGTWTGLVWINLYTLDTSLGVPAGTIVGRALVDFGTGATFGTYTSTYTYAQGGLYADRSQISPILENDIGEVIRTKALLAPGALKPFADGTVLTDALRLRVREIFVFNTIEGNEISLPTVVIDVNGLKKRLRLEVRDNVLGKVICSDTRSSADGATVAEFVAALPEWIVLTDFQVASADKRSATAHIRLDLTGITDVLSNIGATTAVIHQDNIFTADRQGDYLSDHRAETVVKVGVGQAYTTVDAAQAAIYSSALADTNVNGLPVSDAASYQRRVRIFLTDEAEYLVSGDKTKLADFVELDGVPGATLKCLAPATSGAIDAIGTHKLRNVKIKSGSPLKYALHMDESQQSVRDAGQFARRRKLIDGLSLENPEGSTTQVLGGGISSWEEWIINGLSAVNLNPAATAAAIGIHNSGIRAVVPTSRASLYGASVLFMGASSPNILGLDLYSIAEGPINTANLVGCGFRSIRIGCNIADADAPARAADRYVWNAVGRHDAPIYFSDDQTQPVLQTTAGQTPSGDAAALIFGVVDELGRGDQWIKTGTIRSLGARLGDCSSVSKTLTIGAQSHVFNTNLTAVANTTIIAAINASITTHPVSEVDIQSEYIAPCTPQARMTNGSGVTIPKGRFVKRTGASTVALAQPGDAIYGWTWRDILNGNVGVIATTRSIHQSYIENAASASGQWGLAADGELDFAAVSKVGVVAGSIVDVW
ncbi:hypothetical protein [Brevundimonas sp. LjRoot202]|uniref:hypothetical protein n=1 Tax=Brevundimonas sp. LjRoot202 TaxID=3342281 RepID=UPI003ED02CBE